MELAHRMSTAVKMWYSRGVEGLRLPDIHLSLFLPMNKVSQVVNCFIQWVQKTPYNNQNIPGIFLIEEYQYVVDEYGIIRFED